jgi:hypothetical protein
MQPSWVLGDGTRIDLKTIANRDDLSVFANKHWSARVNGTTVPTDTKTLRGTSTENLFTLPDGRDAIARVVMSHGARICDLSIGDQIILYPGDKPFTCPSCRNTVEPQLQTCPLCQTEQPTYEARVLQMQRKGLATSILHLNVVCVLLGIAQMLAFHPEPAFASLVITGAGTPHAGSQYLLQHALTGLATYMLCIFGCALLALRAPALAAVLNLVAFLYMLSSHALTPEGSWFAMALAGFLLFSSLATAERGFELARASKKV